MWEFWLLLFVLSLLAVIWSNYYFTYLLCVSAFLTIFITFKVSAWYYQLAFFIISTSIASFIYNKYNLIPIHTLFHKQHNLQKLIGQTGIALSIIGLNKIQSGLVRLDGENWRAVSLASNEIKCGRRVKVLKISGLYLLVIPY